MEPSLQNLNKAAATNGLLIGIISFVLGVLIYYVAPQMMGSAMFGIGMIVFSLLIYIYFTIDLRKKIGGFWSFGQAFKGIFIMAFVGGVLASLLNVVFYKFIEPNAFSVISGYVESGATETLSNLGMEQDAIDEQVEKQLEAMKAQFDPTVMDFLKNFGIGLIIQVIMSLIFAAIFKKEAPKFAPIDEDDVE